MTVSIKCSSETKLIRGMIERQEDRFRY